MADLGGGDHQIEKQHRRAGRVVQEDEHAGGRLDRREYRAIGEDRPRQDGAGGNLALC